MTHELTRASAPRTRMLKDPLRLWQATSQFRPVLAVLAVLFVVFTTTQSVFFTSANLENLLTGVSVLFVVSVAMTFVLISGGADLSVGAIAALVGIFFAKVDAGGVPGWLALLASLGFGAVVGGIVNGFLIARLRLSFFVVTLASMTALTGVVNLWSGTRSFFVSTNIPSKLAIDRWIGIPAPIVIMALVALLGLYLQHETFLGRDIYAIGGSPKAAMLSGVRTVRVTMLVYSFAGLASALGGIITIGRIGVATPQVDNNLPLLAIAAVLLGGTSLAGGRGGVGGTVAGVLFIGVLQNGLSISGVPSFWQQVVTGVILVAAVLGDRMNFQVKNLTRTLFGWPR